MTTFTQASASPLPRATAPTAWAVAVSSGIRAVVGVMWAINALLTWQPEFATHYAGYLQNAMQGQPPWLQAWLGAWLAAVSAAPTLFLTLTRLLETVLAIGLLAGLARKWVAIVGMAFSLLIWSTAEGFGGPYTVGATNLGPALVYVLVFAALLLFDRLLGRTPYSVDYYLEQRWPGWRRVAEVAPTAVLARVPARLPWHEQLAAIVVLAAALVFLFGSLESALSVPPPTPANAAAAVSPLQLASSQPIARARDATLPALLGTGATVDLSIDSSDANVEIASDVTYEAWTFGDSVPGPTFHVRQGQTVNVTYTNHGMSNHSLDFHAAQVDPAVAYRDIKPGETIRYSFVANTPGVFVYHCGTAPVLLHMANGMYGAIVVDPAQGLPPADHSYVIVQGEWYTKQVRESVMGSDFNKMKAAAPDEVVFNGVAFQYRDQPLTARVGERIRLYLADAGPNLPSAFHIIGGMFDAVYADGDPAHPLTGVSTYTVAPGQGVVFDYVPTAPGDYPFVDHSMRNNFLGAVGVLHVTP